MSPHSHGSIVFENTHLTYSVQVLLYWFVIDLVVKIDWLAGMVAMHDVILKPYLVMNCKLF